MWVLCCGMQRSGSTLQYQVVTRIAQFLPNVHIVGWVSPVQTHEIFDSATDSPDEWHIAKLHDYDDAVAAFWDKFQPKAIYSYRDIRDVVVSNMNMQKWEFDSPEVGAIIHNVLTNYRHWSQKPGILITRYEELIADGGLRAEVRRIAEYLGVQLPPGQIEQIAESVSLPAVKQRIENFDYDTKGIQYPNTRMDPQSLFHDKHIHSGATEQWRTALTPQQVAVVETWAGEWLAERGYPVEPRTDQQQLHMLRQLLESTQATSTRQTDIINGQRAYIKHLELKLLAQAEAHPAAKTRTETSVPPLAPAHDSALLRQVEAYEAQLQAIRSRKIARFLAWLGRPIA